jgi:dolichol-phosphate mannosyltransferase
MAEATPLLTLILPTRNERQNAPQLVLELLRVFGAQVAPGLPGDAGAGLEILLIDASDDGTSAAVTAAWQSSPLIEAAPGLSLRCLSQQSMGFSGAVGEGLQLARGQWLLCLNADGQHRVADALALFQARQLHTLVVGSRFVPGGETPYSLIRRLMSQLASRIVAAISGVPLRDCFSSFFLLERGCLDGLDLAAIVSGRGEGMLKLAASLRQRRVSLREVPIRSRERLAGASKTDLIRFLAAYLQAAWQLRRQRRPNRLLLVLLRLLPLAVLAVLLARDPASLRQLLAHPLTLLACAGVLIASTLLRAVRWQQIARIAGLRQPLRAAIDDVAQGRLINELSPVRVGEVVRISRIRGRDGSRLTPVLLCLLWEKISGFGIGLIGFAVLYGLASQRMLPGSTLAFTLLAAVITVLGSTALWGALLALVQGGRSWLSSQHHGRQLRVLWDELSAVDLRCSGVDWSLTLPMRPVLGGVALIAERLAAIPIPGVFATSLVGFVIWSCTALSLALLANALAIPVTLLEAGAAAFAAGVFSQVRLLPQAAGQSELAIVLVLTSLGKPLTASVLLATADLLLQRIITILLGVVLQRSARSADCPVEPLSR